MGFSLLDRAILLIVSLHFLVPDIEQSESVLFAMVPLGSYEDYGTSQPPRSSQNKMRTVIVASALALSMIVAVVFVAKNNWTASGPVADLAISPDSKLQGLVVSLAEHSTTMSLAEMESKLDAWRKDPSTLLDMPENERMQVIRRFSWIQFRK